MFLFITLAFSLKLTRYLFVVLQAASSLTGFGSIVVLLCARETNGISSSSNPLCPMGGIAQSLLPSISVDFEPSFWLQNTQVMLISIRSFWMLLRHASLFISRA